MSDEVVIPAGEIPENYADFKTWRANPSSATDTTEKVASPDAPKEAEVKAEAESDTASDNEEQDTGHRIPKWRFDQEIGKKNQLKEELDQVKAERDALKALKDDKQPASASKAEPSTEFEPPQFPVQADFDTWEAYEAAQREFPKLMDAHVHKVAQSERVKAIAEVQERQRQQDELKQLGERVSKAKEQFPDFEETITPAAKALITDQQVHQAVTAFINESPDFLAILHEIGKDKAELGKFIELAKTNPGAAIRQAAIIEASLTKVNPAPEPKAEVQTRAPQPINPLKKSVTPDGTLRDDLDWKEWRKRREAQLRS